jgi:hypothetical protein
MVMPNMCGDPDPEYLPFAYYAGQHGLTINDGMAARYDDAARLRYCADLQSKVDRGEVDHRSLYVLSRDTDAQLRRAARSPMVCGPGDLVVICVTAESYLPWGTLAALDYVETPSRAETDRFREALEMKYTRDLRRQPGPAQLEPSIATEQIGRYLRLRLNGCTHADASARVLSMMDGTASAPVCLEELGSSAAIHPGQTAAFRGQLEARVVKGRGPWTGMTAVDAEGEARWLHEYVLARARGCSEIDARERVFAEIDDRPSAARCGG